MSNEDDMQPVTKKELREELARFATKDDLREALTHVATKEDLAVLRSEWGEFKGELRSEWGEFKSELRSEWGEFKSQFRAEINQDIARHFNVAMEQFRVMLGALDDKYRDLPARMARLEVAVFDPPTPTPAARRAPKKRRRAA